MGAGSSARTPLALTMVSLCPVPGNGASVAAVTKSQSPSHRASLSCFCCNYRLQLSFFPPPTSSFRALLPGLGGEEEGVSLLLDGLGMALLSVSPVPLPVGAEATIWDVGSADGCCLDPGCSEPLQKVFTHCGVQCDVSVLGDALLQGGFSSKMLWVVPSFFFFFFFRPFGSDGPQMRSHFRALPGCSVWGMRAGLPALPELRFNDRR